MENFTSNLIHQVGDLIHYQENDYCEKTPIDSSKYNLIGSILRRIGSSGIEKITVKELIGSEYVYFNNNDDQQTLLLLEDFNAIMLVDLVSRMQGLPEDDTFLKKMEEVKIIYNIN